jgi:hypothetical protein
MRHDVAPGGVFPDYELPDHTGKLRKLSQLQGDGPLIGSDRCSKLLEGVVVIS